jgi:antitoxin HigA-1
MKKLSPIHPGEILREEFLTPLSITNNKLALDLHVPASRIDQIVKGKRAISADTAIRLGMYFNTTPGFWLNLQANYELQRLESKALADIRNQVQARVA